MTKTRDLKIGDVEPFVCEDLVALHSVRLQRGRLQSAAKRAEMNGNWANNQAKKIIDEHDERSARLSDPFEQARRYLQSRGLVIFAARVLGQTYRKSDFVIKGKDGVFKKREIIALAKRKGWKP